MKKGFTLLEMLAVIVVISILSLIILPNITGQLADKKEEISKVSQKIILSAAELYANETGNTYQTITINDLVEAGKLEQPIIDQKTGKEISLTKEISIDASGNACIVGIDGCDRITCKKYENGTAIYYNPETGKKCNNDYIEKNSTTGTKSGCMKWYAFNDNDKSSTVNVILDHNTTTGVIYNSTGNNSEMKEVKTRLENGTKDWNNDLNPRLIEANEIAKITGHQTFDASKENQEWFYLDSNNQTQTASSTNKSKYAWLFDYTYECTSYGCNTSDSSNYGYWTSTSYKDNSTSAWRVDRNGNLRTNDVTFTGLGVRPVITISKPNI